MRSVIRRWTRLSPVVADVQCDHCGEWFNPASPDASYPHNNHR
ncbi:hypothetical protein [Nocardiopsis sp. NRRL B-16309]|nr:hypothetical protein [Nocardiopsis sp. NRRL B-16309]